MQLLQKILIATDFSSTSDRVFHDALEIARVFKSEIYLIHAIPEFKEDLFSVDEVKNMAETKLSQYKKTAQAAGQVIAKRCIEIGEPFKRIIQCADYNQVNVIFIGAGGKNEKGDFHLGITAERLLRRSTKPVWIVKGDGKPQVNSILCPVDSSKHSQRILKNAVHLARQLKAKLTIMHVIKPLSSIFTLFSESTLALKQNQYHSEQEGKFDSILTGVDFHGIDWEKIIRQGQPSPEILNTASQFNTDLIVMGVLGVTSDPDVSMGRVAEKVTQALPCSLILVKKEEPIQLRLEREIKDTEDHIKLGWELLGNGLPEEALVHFQHCVSKHLLHLPAWKGMLATYERLGNLKAVQDTKNKIKEIDQEIWQNKVEAEVRKGFINKIKGKQ